MRNNNQAIVRKIVRRSLTANYGRNAFIVLAVFLTTFMLGTIISLSVSYMETQTAHLIRILGTTAHVNLFNVPDDKIEIIKNFDYVSICSISITSGIVQDSGYLNGNNVILEWCEPVEWENFRKPVISNIFGQYPQNYDEIMVPSWILENMGISQPHIGMEITLNYQIDMGQRTQVFILSGWFTSYVLSRYGDTESIYVSQAFMNDTGRTAAEYGRVQIQYTKNNFDYNERLVQDTPIDVGLMNMHTYTLNNELDPLQIVFVIIIVFIIIAGFMLIYNVMSISISRDIRFYGLLKATGMTPRQIRNVVLQQILLLCVFGIPVGLIFSVLISFVVVPWFIYVGAFMGQVDVIISFNPIIYIGTVLFTLITALFAAFNPAKKAADISPIEAVRFSEQRLNWNVSRSSAFNSMRIAWRNVFRVRKRAVLVFFGMFMGMSAFLFVTTILDSTDIDIYAESATANFSGDIYLINRMPKYVMFDFYFNNIQAFTPELMERLNLLPGLIDMDIRYARQVQIDTGYLNMDGSPHYRTDFIYEFTESEESIIYDINLYIEENAQKQVLDIIKEWTNAHQYIQWRSEIAIREEVEQLKNTLMIFGGSISIILWLIGVLNFINIISTSIISRKHEIALLESIGQSRKQSKRLLTSEGIIYAVITLLLVCILGGSFTYGFYSLLANQFEYVSFNFPYLPLLVMVCAVFIVCLSIPRLTYRFVSKMTLVERLREVQ